MLILEILRYWKNVKRKKSSKIKGFRTLKNYWISKRRFESMEKMTSVTCIWHLISSFQHLSAFSSLRSLALALLSAILDGLILAILRLLFWLMYWKLSASTYTIAPFWIFYKVYFKISLYFILIDLC